jgi:HK97 family phage portal protein
MNQLQALIARWTGLDTEMARMQSELAEARGGFEVVLEAWNQNKANANGIVTPEGALRLSAVFACARVLGETMATLPLHMYEFLPDGSRRQTRKHNVYRVLQNPNEFMTGFDLMETLMQHLALRGNAYCQIEYDERGQIIEIDPLPPQNIIDSVIEGEKRFYQYQYPNGKVEWLSGDIIWHLRGLGNGLTGYSPIGLMRRAVSLGLSAEEFGNRFFDNDARPGIVLEHPLKLTKEAHQRLSESWDDTHKGVEKSHRVAILEEGMKLHEVGIPPEDAQFLETRKFQVNEIARIFRVPPHMIGDLERSTNNNIEHQGIEFVKYTVLPWIKRFEQSIRKFLFLPRDQERYYIEYLVAGLERGDIQSRYQAYAVARQNGWMSANDIRQLENMEPIEGGEVYLVPMNMIPADQVGMSASTEPVPAAPPDAARSQPVDREERALRSARARHRMASAQRRVAMDLAERSIKRECQDVNAAAKKYLGRRDSGQFMIWLDDYYQQHADWMKRFYLPWMQAYGEMVAAEALDEVNRSDDLQERLARFIDSYAGSFAAQQVGVSQYRLKDVMQQAANDGVDQQQAVEAEMDHWQEARPAQIAGEQTTRENNAVAKMVYTAVGVRILRWVTMGETCPYCSSLNGRTVEITRNFLAMGQELAPDGASPMTTTTNIGHPPVHDGCDCMIAAG